MNKPLLSSPAAAAPSMPPDATLFELSAFEQRWLAELVRRGEEREGTADDALAVAAARAAGGGLEARILHRAGVLAAADGRLQALRRWRARAGGMLLVAGLAALLAGLGMAAGVLGDGSRPVNVIWALGGLLGVHALSLVLWLVFALPAGGAAGGRGGLIGGLWLKLVTLSDRSPAAADLPAALSGLLTRGRLGVWTLGAVTHFIWTLLLCGAALGVLGLLATRRYGFVWETTILPAEVFVAVTAALGALPALLGFPVPDAGMVTASSLPSALDDAARRAWAGWLLGSLLVWGVLPRGALMLVCVLVARRAARAARLDLGLPAYVALRERLLPGGERLGVSDPAPAGLAVVNRPPAGSVHSGEVLVFGLELDETLPWPPFAGGLWPPGVEDGGRLDEHVEREAALCKVVQLRPARLLLVVDGAQTPDRGHLGLIGALAAQGAELRLWACGSARRLGQWQAALTAAGFAAGTMLAEEAAVRDWLAGGAQPAAGAGEGA